jgi:hypothetical protein
MLGSLLLTIALLLAVECEGRGGVFTTTSKLPEVKGAGINDQSDKSSDSSDSSSGSSSSSSSSSSSDPRSSWHGSSLYRRGGEVGSDVQEDGGKTSLRRSLIRNLGGLWGVLQVVSILANAIKRLVPIALQPFVQKDMTPAQWTMYGAWCVFMAYTEGYKAFQMKFSPLVVNRAFGIR